MYYFILLLIKIKIKEIINNNDIIHINLINLINKQKIINFLNYNKCKYLYITDFDSNDSININNFRVIKHNNNICKDSIYNFIKKKIFIENYNYIFYEFININSIYYIMNIFLNTRVYKIKTIICTIYKLPPSIRENIDIIIN